MNFQPIIIVLMLAFGLVAISGIEDIPVLSYEAVMQHECKYRIILYHIYHIFA